METPEVVVHQPLGGSGAPTWIHCAGSVRKAAKFPNESDSASIDGTHDHTLLEACVDGLRITDPVQLVGETLTDHEGSFEVDIERAKRVLFAVNYLKQRIDELGKPLAIRSEFSTDPGKWICRKDMSGTLDLGLINDDTLEVIDYKGGWTPVDPTTEQLKHYGVGVLWEYHSVDHQKRVVFPFQKVRLTIVQPRNAEKGMDAVQWVETTPQELMTWASEIMFPAASATDDPNASLTAGEKQCRWCNARRGCQALLEQSLADAGLSFPNLHSEAGNVDPAGYTDEQLLHMKEAIPLLQVMIKAIDAEAEDRLVKRRHPIPGLKVVAGRGSRAFKTENDDETVAMLQKCGIPKKECVVTKVLSPAQAEKLTWESKKRGSDEVVLKQLSEKQLERLKEYIRHEPGTPKVVLESEPGEPIDIGVAEGTFAPVQSTPAAPALPDWLQPK